MPIELVGKLHRSVFIENCDPNFVEDLVTLLQRKCGAVEAWDAVSDVRYVVVFQSVNSVSVALVFHQMSFSDPTKKLLVWNATSPPPAGVGQLALAGPAADSQKARDAKRREDRERRQAALRSLAGEVGGPVQTAAAMSDEERRVTLRHLAVRQLQALLVLTNQELTMQELQWTASSRALEASKESAQRVRDQTSAYDAALQRAKEDA